MAIDDGVFRHLKPLRELNYLNLAYTNIAGNFSELADLPLRDVRLEGCQHVGDRCAQALANFDSLRQLEIHMTRLTEAGVHHLAHRPLEATLAGRADHRPRHESCRDDDGVEASRRLLSRRDGSGCSRNFGIGWAGSALAV